MASLRYVCLSDLHLGAGYSILTPIGPEGKFVQKGGDSVQMEFGTALRAYVSKLSDPASLSDPAKLPTLILMGDVVDLSFSSTAVSAMAYRRFVQALFPKDEDPVFGPTIFFLPGNHDHHLWRTLQDRHFVEQIEELLEVQAALEEGVAEGHPISEFESALKMSGMSQFFSETLARTSRRVIKMAIDMAAPDQREIQPLMQVTPLLEEPHLESPFLTEILNKATGHTFSVKTAYPNLGFTNGSKCLVLHHGHFVESMYAAVSHLTAWMSGRTSIPDNVNDLEAENGGWIDFLWSELGSAGAVGDDTVKMYQILQDPAATREKTELIASRLAEVLLQRLPASGMPNVRQLTEQLTKVVFCGALERYNSSERYGFESVLSAQSLDTLRWYLHTPVRKQLETEVENWSPGPREEIPDDLDLTFIFGHTHKPFQDLMFLDQYPNPVKLFNTGGWVLDEARQPTTQGAAAVFIDDDLNVASLRLFQANPAGTTKLVRVEDERGKAVPDAKSGVQDINLWKRLLVDALSSTQDAWDKFSEAATNNLNLRSKIIFGYYFNPKLRPEIAEGEKEATGEEKLTTFAAGGAS